MDITDVLGWIFLVVVLAVCVVLGSRDRRKAPRDTNVGGETGASWQGGGGVEHNHHAGGHLDGGGHSGGHGDGGGHGGH